MKRFILYIFLFVNSLLPIFAQGNVYLIIGSDTAIWDAMDVSKYNCTYNYNVIPDRTRNYFEVMQPAYRSRFADSFGNQIKFTWWLMCGNIFRYATNKNVPYPNMIVPYQAKKYYGEAFSQFGDELTLHYHTFAWTDYNGDGNFFWNQAKDFNECKDDFYYTLAQLLVEENIFPVSFRSGWNTMDNNWQAELDKLIPYSMHNEAPAYRVDNEEPLDNNFDWRLASKEFIPYRPSSQNYQLPGNGRGYNLHSKYAGNITQAAMNDIFSKAKITDQVVCLWGHVWDDQFPEYVLRIDSLAKKSANLYSTVKFKYCTAVEGMQLWLKGSDFTPPVINFQEIISGNKIKFGLTFNEPIFQIQPFLAVKFLDETYRVVPLIQNGSSWISSAEYNIKDIAKAAIAVTDTMGNLSTRIINYLPDDIYVDNSSPDYAELRGNWITEKGASWGMDSRKSVLTVGDSAKVRWNFKITFPYHYNIFAQVPKVEAQSNKMSFRVYINNQLVDTKHFENGITSLSWIHISTLLINPSENNYIELVAYGIDQDKKVLSADVVKITPLVRNKWLYLSNDNINLGYVVKKDTVETNILITNYGIEDLTINIIYSANNLLSVKTVDPIIIPKFGSFQLPVYFRSADLGSKTDTLFLDSDDSFNPTIKVVFTAEVQNYFRIVDNEETVWYKEFGNWSQSVAQAYGSSSRYANLNQNPRPYAQFTTSVAENAYYNIFFIVPKTENASNRALYIFEQQNNFIDSLYIDQNLNSGNWVLLKNKYLKKEFPVIVKIIDDGKATAGAVLRTDAVKIDFTSYTSVTEYEITLPEQFQLSQNYPNPFNPTTIIGYHLPTSCFVILKVYDVLGKDVKTIVNEFQNAGYYKQELRFENGEAASGIYFYRLTANNYFAIRKMLYLK